MNSIVTAIKSFKRNSTMALASIVLVSLTLLVVGFVLMIATNTTVISRAVVDDLVLYTYMQPDITDEQVTGLETQISSISGITGVVLSTKEQELADIQASFPGESDLITDYFSEDNPLSDVYKVQIDESITDFPTVEAQISALEGVESVDWGDGNGIEGLISVMSLIQIGSVAVSFILVFVSVFIITNTIRLAITARRKEIEIMRLVGATKFYIRGPFIWEGILIGLFGSIFSFGVLLYLYQQIFVIDFFAVIRSGIVSIKMMCLILAIGLPIMGILIGMIGSYIALNKHLKN